MTTIAEAEERMAKAYEAVGSALHERRDAKAALLAMWRPMVVSGAVAYNDWAGSFTRGAGGPPSRDDMVAAGWCPNHPVDWPLSGPAECHRKGCTGVGCPGPKPEPNTPEEWVESMRAAGERISLSVADAAGFCADNPVIRKACGAIPMPNCRNPGCNGRGCPGPAPKAESDVCGTTIGCTLGSGHDGICAKASERPASRLAYYPPADEAEIDALGRVVPQHLTAAQVQAKTRPEPERIADDDGDEIEVSRGARFVSLSMDGSCGWCGRPEQARSLASALLRAADEVDPDGPAHAPPPTAAEAAAEAAMRERDHAEKRKAAEAMERRVSNVGREEVRREIEARIRAAAETEAFGMSQHDLEIGEDPRDPDVIMEKTYLAMAYYDRMRRGAQPPGPCDSALVDIVRAVAGLTTPDPKPPGVGEE